VSEAGAKSGRGILAVQTEARAGADDEYNAWYDGVHVPEVLATPGFLSCRRFRLLHSPHAPAGHEQEWARYLAIYEIAGRDLAGAHGELMARVHGGELTISAALAPRPYRSQLFEQIAEHP
jgi:hypothetical protein